MISVNIGANLLRPGGGVKTTEDFFNLYNHAFIRAAVAVPRVRVADPAFNAREVVELMAEAVARRATVVLFPELCLSAYSCEDLFHQGALIEACRSALGDIVAESRAWPVVAVVGTPLL